MNYRRKEVVLNLKIQIEDEWNWYFVFYWKKVFSLVFEIKFLIEWILIFRELPTNSITAFPKLLNSHIFIVDLNFLKLFEHLDNFIKIILKPQIRKSKALYFNSKYPNYLYFRNDPFKYPLKGFSRSYFSMVP